MTLETVHRHTCHTPSNSVVSEGLHGVNAVLHWEGHSGIPPPCIHCFLLNRVNVTLGNLLHTDEMLLSFYKKCLGWNEILRCVFIHHRLNFVECHSFEVICPYLSSVFVRYCLPSSLTQGVLPEQNVENNAKAFRDQENSSF